MVFWIEVGELPGDLAREVGHIKLSDPADA
jgi:hypothetical protein